MFRSIKTQQKTTMNKDEQHTPFDGVTNEPELAEGFLERAGVRQLVQFLEPSRLYGGLN